MCLQNHIDVVGTIANSQCHFAFIFYQLHDLCFLVGSHSAENSALACNYDVAQHFFMLLDVDNAAINY